MKNLDNSKVFSVLKSELKNYINKYNFKSIVIGISGGIDSTVSSVICSEVAKELSIPFIGLLLPSSSNKQVEMESSLEVARAFTSDYRISNINDLYENFVNSIPNSFNQTPISRGNVLARLRMTMIRNIANITGGLTIDNSNFTEYNLGFFTVNDGQDYCLIRDLWKTEVYDLANYLENYYRSLSKSKEDEYIQKADAIKYSIGLVPTDGLGISSSDLEQIGANSYEEVDKILEDFLSFSIDYTDKESAIKDYLEFNALYDINMCIIKKVLERHLNSEYKRKYPIYIKRELYI